MCIIYLAFDQHPDYPLILLANRDEFYARPTLSSDYWPDHPNIYAGRDLQGGGTWLGVTLGGRFAAVTNYRDPSAPTGVRSRGELVADFLKSDELPLRYLYRVENSATHYSGFNLIVGELNAGRTEIGYFSNRGNQPQLLSSGIYGLSNHLLDTAWPKVTSGRNRLLPLLSEAIFDRAKCFDILADRTLAPDHELPATGVPLDVEKAISGIFVETPGYGTRCSTVLTFDSDLNWDLDERIWV
jgi:uncharacterized protein with NRDE domain